MKINSRSNSTYMCNMIVIRDCAFLKVLYMMLVQGNKDRNWLFRFTRNDCDKEPVGSLKVAKCHLTQGLIRFPVGSAGFTSVRLHKCLLKVSLKCPETTCKKKQKKKQETWNLILTTFLALIFVLGALNLLFCPMFSLQDKDINVVQFYTPFGEVCNKGELCIIILNST